MYNQKDALDFRTVFINSLEVAEKSLMETPEKLKVLSKFNVVDADTLRKAKKSPEEYRDLIVRVAGYSDYFVDLTEELQDEIIRRTEHKEL